MRIIYDMANQQKNLQRNIYEAIAESLAAGKLVSFPTETVYALVADASCDAAIQAVYDAKGRNQESALAVFVKHIEQAEEFVDFSPVAVKLARAFWPGGLTLVLPQKAETSLSPALNQGKKSLAVRCPDHLFAQGVLAAFGKPVAATSTNRSGETAACDYLAAESFAQGKDILVYDGGRCSDGVASTVLAVEGDSWKIIREGTITASDIEHVIG